MNIEEKEFLIQEAGKNQFRLLLVTEILNEVSHSLVCENSNENSKPIDQQFLTNVINDLNLLEETIKVLSIRLTKKAISRDKEELSIEIDSCLLDGEIWAQLDLMSSLFRGLRFKTNQVKKFDRTITDAENSLNKLHEQLEDGF